MDKVAEIFLSGHEELSYKDKFLGDEVIGMLCQKLRTNEKKKLILRGNYLGSTGAKAIADLITTQDSLEHISLEWNQICGTGGEYFAEALKSNRSVTYLDLRNNNITSDAAIAFAETMATNKTLRTLDLRWNQIEDRGALAFKRAILERRPPLNLLVNGNLLTEATMITINAWLKRAKEFGDEEVELPKPPKDDVPKQIQNEFLQKEIYNLRHQLTACQSSNADLQRQLDASLLKITELEQQLTRSEYFTSQLTENLKQAQIRISVLTDERNSLLANWEKERNELVNEMIKAIKEKENEVRDLSIERDNLKDRINKLGDENDQLRVQYEHLQQQLATDREVNQNELRIAYTRINDYALSETKLKAENAALKTTNMRFTEKIKMLEEDLKFNIAERDRMVKQEHDFYEEETKKLKAEHASLMTALVDRNMTQAQEIANLQALILALRSEISQQKIEIEQAYENALKAAKEAERERSEHIINDLKQRLEAMTSARDELQIRCDNYMKEIQSLQVDHSKTMHNLKSQIDQLNDELQRLRAQINQLKIALHNTESNNKNHEIEIQELRKKLQKSEEQGEKWYKELHAALQAKQSLEMQTEKLSLQINQFKENRQHEYHIITQSIMNSVKNEFETMKLNLKIQHG